MYEKMDIDEKLRDCKKENYSIVTLDNWADIEKIFSQKYDQWIFRGQQECGWNIQPSLCRKNINYACESAEEILRNMWKDTKDFAEIKKMKTEFDRLCLMQHYGVSTRLLDWTRCPYIAAFFAFYGLVETKTSHCSVWAINKEWCEDMALRRIKKILNDPNVDKNTDLRRDEYFDRLFKEDPGHPGFVLPQCPSCNFPRLKAQKGIFLFQSQSELNFEENLLGEYTQIGRQDSAEEIEEKKVLWVEIPGCFIQFKISCSLRKDFNKKFTEKKINVAELFQGSLDYYGNFVLRQFEQFDKIAGQRKQEAEAQRKAGRY